MSIAHVPVRPLLVTADAELLDDVLRLSAAAGVAVEVAADLVSARASWVHAPIVLVGDDVSVGLARHPMRRRTDVVVVSRDLDDASIWERAMQ